MIKRLLLNWRTTSIGVAMIVGAGVDLAFSVSSGDADAKTWKNDILIILGGCAAVVAGDAAASAGKQDLKDVKDAVVTGNTEQLTKGANGNTQPPGT